MQKHCNIPIFLPELACIQTCVFCNQRSISSTLTIPSGKEIEEKIERYLATMDDSQSKQIAFFGGSFTGLPQEVQHSYLQIAYSYIKKGMVESIRISTRPDLIQNTILQNLQEYNVVDIELGAQSFDDTVLQMSKRGHTADDTKRAAEMILKHGFKLGLQMMIGLPGDTYERAIHTAQTIIQTGAHSTRIYPCLVIENTELATMYSNNEFVPLQLQTAIEWTADICTIFDTTAIELLRVGLHPNKDFDSKNILRAGPYHPSFKQLVYTHIWKNRLQASLPQTQGKLVLNVSPADIEYVVGYNSSNKKWLQQHYGWIAIEQNETLQKNEFTYRYC